MPRSLLALSRFHLCTLVLAAFTFVLMAAFTVGDHLAPAGRRLSKITGIDPPAYFGVSHSMLFDRDFDLRNQFSRIKPDENPWTIIRPETGLPGSAYAIGYSILAMPFLAAGTLLDALAGNPVDGFSRFAILGYCMANIVMSGIGLIVVFRFLAGIGELWGISRERASWMALVTTAGIFFGTTVLYYAFSEMSHAATFFCASFFVGCWWKIRERVDARSWAVLGLFGGMLSICRWQEAVFVGAPFVFDFASRKMWKAFPQWVRLRAVYVCAAALCWIPQFLEWKSIYGTYLAKPYSSNVLTFPPPYVLQVLFSTENGWFVWTPVALLGVAGLLFGLVKFGWEYLPWLVVIGLEVSVVGATQAWHGADAFSSRYMTSSAVLVAIGLATLFYAASRPVRGLLGVVVAGMCLFSCLFVLQFRLDLIPRQDRLTAAELFTDKLRLPRAMKRKSAVRQAEAALKEGSVPAAIQILEQATASYGANRDTLDSLRKAYRVNGQSVQAGNADRQWQELMQSRLW